MHFTCCASQQNKFLTQNTLYKGQLQFILSIDNLFLINSYSIPANYVVYTTYDNLTIFLRTFGRSGLKSWEFVL